MKTKITILLLLAVAMLSQSIHADVTVWIRSTQTSYTAAPRIYATDASGKALLGAYPGKSLTAKDGDWWLCVIPNVAQANIQINNGGNGTYDKTAIISNVTGTKFYGYNGYADYITYAGYVPNSPTAVAVNDQNFPDALFTSRYAVVSQTDDDSDRVTFCGWVDNLDGHLSNYPTTRFIYINPVNFPDGGFIRYLLTGVEHSNIFLITEQEISQITEIDCSEKSINSLEGIGFFTSLATLKCEKNNLIELDLRSNTELINLDCKNNQLEKIDLSGNGKLVKLCCSHNNLVKLDLSNNPMLSLLSCGANQLVELDLSCNANLNVESTMHDWIWFNSQQRVISAEVGWKNVNGRAEKFYFLSLDGKAGMGNGMQTLAEKLHVEDHAEDWWNRVDKATMTGAKLVRGMSNAVAVGDINPAFVYGDILLLTPSRETATEASGKINYAFGMNYPGNDAWVLENVSWKNFTISWSSDPQVTTSVDSVVSSEMRTATYLNVAGMSSDRPWPGVNIVVKRYSDGTVTTTKQLN